MNTSLRSQLSRAIVRTLLLVAFLFVLSFDSLNAAVSQWTGAGADGKWLTAANWNSAPSPADSLLFTGHARINHTNTSGAGTAFGSISFATPAGPFALYGNSIALGGNITDSQVVTLETIN